MADDPETSGAESTATAATGLSNGPCAGVAPVFAGRIMTAAPARLICRRPRD